MSRDSGGHVVRKQQAAFRSLTSAAPCRGWRRAGAGGAHLLVPSGWRSTRALVTPSLDSSNRRRSAPPSTSSLQGQPCGAQWGRVGMGRQSAQRVAMGKHWGSAAAAGKGGQQAAGQRQAHPRGRTNNVSSDSSTPGGSEPPGEAGIDGRLCAEAAR